MKPYHELPMPASAAAQRSAGLLALIQQKIQQHDGCISFADYMEMALYHPEFGYYQQPQFSLGKTGDFTTAPEISPLFARCFAGQCQAIMLQSGAANILELGAGSGRFALDLLAALETLQCLPNRYYILEISQSLRIAQQNLLQRERPDLVNRVEWLSALPVDFCGIVIANEVLDAVPFDCIEWSQQQIMQRMVTMKNNELQWQLKPSAESLMQQALSDLQNKFALPAGYQSEIQLPAMTLVRQLCAAVKEGVILLADYGYGQREYYHPERSTGTLTCFYQHHAHRNPFFYPGLQDITSHIDFTRVIETAAEHGAQLLGFTTQSAFLLANKLVEEAARMEETLDTQEAFRLHQAMKTLTLPTEMGETVKVMALGLHYSHALKTFSLADRRRDL